MFKTLEGQQVSNSQLNDSQTLLEQLKPLYDAFNTSKICIDVAVPALCHYHFPSCDRTGSTIQERRPCKAMCDYFMKTCMKLMGVVQKVTHKYFNCSILPIREAGTSPECWYYNGWLNGKLKKTQNNCIIIIIVCLHASVCPFLLKSMHFPLMSAICLTIFQQLATFTVLSICARIRF